MAQGGIGQTALGQKSGVCGGVRPRLANLGVEYPQVHKTVLRGAKARQRIVLPSGGGEGEAIHPHAQVGKGEGGDGLGGENMYIVRPNMGVVGGMAGEGVVVAGGDAHRAGEARQGGGKCLHCLGVDGGGVKEVPRQQGQIHLSGHGQIPEGIQGAALFPAAALGLPGGRERKGVSR